MKRVIKLAIILIMMALFLFNQGIYVSAYNTCNLRNSGNAQKLYEIDPPYVGTEK